MGITPLIKVSYYFTLIGSGALGATSFCSRISSQNAAGITVFKAFWSSTIRSGLLAPGTTAATAGFASENCNAAALILIS